MGDVTHVSRAPAQVPQLPRELMAKIFRHVWRWRDAAVHVQKHVRGCIARADGAPWDMPALVEHEYTWAELLEEQLRGALHVHAIMWMHAPVAVMEDRDRLILMESSDIHMEDVD